MKFCDLLKLLFSFNMNMRVSVYFSEYKSFLKHNEEIPDDVFSKIVKDFSYFDNKLFVVL